MHLLKALRHNGSVVVKGFATFFWFAGFIPDRLILHVGKVLEPGLPKDTTVCIENIGAEGRISEDVIHGVLMDLIEKSSTATTYHDRHRRQARKTCVPESGFNQFCNTLLD